MSFLEKLKEPQFGHRWCISG